MGPYPHAQKFKAAIEIIFLAGCRHFNEGEEMRCREEEDIPPREREVLAPDEDGMASVEDGRGRDDGKWNHAMIYHDVRRMSNGRSSSDATKKVSIGRDGGGRDGENGEKNESTAPLESNWRNRLVVKGFDFIPVFSYVQSQKIFFKSKIC